MEQIVNSIKVRPSLQSELVLFHQMEKDETTANFIMPYSYEEHLQKFDQPDVVYLTVVEQQKNIGFIILAFDRDNASIEFRRIVIFDKGRGLGLQAICLMEKYCQTVLKRLRIWLDVFEYNQRGIYLYEKLGYRQFKKESCSSGTLLFYEKTLQ
ncbi:MAG: GNAT family N-acetyltransferase [Formosimonas sp.]